MVARSIVLSFNIVLIAKTKVKKSLSKYQKKFYCNIILIVFLNIYKSLLIRLKNLLKTI